MLALICYDGAGIELTLGRPDIAAAIAKYRELGIRQRLLSLEVLLVHLVHDIGQVGDEPARVVTPRVEIVRMYVEPFWII